MIDEEQKRRWLYELDLNGFIILRNFLPLDFIDQLYEEVHPILLGEIHRLTQGDQSATRGLNRVGLDLLPYANALEGPLEDDRLRRNPVIDELVGAVMPNWRYSSIKAECPLPGSIYMNWHADTDDAFLSKPLRPVRITFNVPLTDINNANAPMEIIPGSHRMHHHNLRSIYSIPQVHALSILLRKGDCMLRDGNALHRGSPNLTDHPRILLGQTYKIIED